MARSIKEDILILEQFIDVDWLCVVKFYILDFYLVQVSMLIVLVIRTKGKSIEHLQILKHLFIFVNQIGWVELWTQSLHKVLRKWIVS